MTSLIAIISSGKGTWGQVLSLIKLYKWEKVFLICNDFSYQNFKYDSNKVLKLLIDTKNPQKSIDKLSEIFKNQINDIETAINLSSGTGMEHMIVITSILKSGLGLRFVYADYNELKELKIFNDEIIGSNEDSFIFL